MFDVGNPIEITVQVDTPAGPENLIHVFRQPMHEDYLKYERALRESGGISADLELWKRCIEAVKNYTLHGQDLLNVDDWKQRVPAPHRAAAINALLRAKGWIPKQEAQKNSGGPSA